MNELFISINGSEYVAKSALDELQEKYDREVAAHRLNAQELKKWTKRALDAEASLNAGARAFMDLHDWSKGVVGPKIYG